jgi:hypothetical protein
LSQKKFVYELGKKMYIFWWWPGSNPVPYIYYTLSIPTELSSRGQKKMYIEVLLGCFVLFFFFFFKQKNDARSIIQDSLKPKKEYKQEKGTRPKPFKNLQTYN